MKREQLGSRLGFIMLSAGCAIGCGNVWKFPWMCGQNGGGSFMLIYLLCLVILGIPALVLEFSIGRAAQTSPLFMYRKLEKPGQKWGIFGWFCLLGNIALMAFYTVVCGWIIYYFVQFLSLDFATLEPEACDMPFGFGSGGGVIFGVTGGVTEAVLRRLTPDHSKETMHEIAECGVRGDEGIKEFTVPYEGMNLNICIASGLANARTVMEQVKNGEKEYHLIEIMSCRRGCIMGGGQPTRSGDRTKALRAKGLYNADNTTIIKKSDENPLVLELYNGLLKGKEHHLLHNDSY